MREGREGEGMGEYERRGEGGEVLYSLQEAWKCWRCRVPQPHHAVHSAVLHVVFRLRPVISVRRPSKGAVLLLLTRPPLPSHTWDSSCYQPNRPISTYSST